MKIKRIEKGPRIEMLPLIDIVFLLLVFFIYAMLSMAVHRGLQLDLPESSQASVTTEREPLSLFIQVNGAELQVTANGRTLSLAELAPALAAIQEEQETPQVLVFAEESINYQQLYQVLDELKKSGLTDISLQASAE